MEAVLFKGATRPAEILGVPIVSLVVIGLPTILLAMWISLWFLLLFVIAFPIVKYLFAKDDNIFRLLSVRYISLIRAKNNINSNGSLVLKKETRTSAKVNYD